MRQLVTFTAGFPAPAQNLVDPLFHTSAARCAEFAKWELAWEPGSRWEYHADSAHWVLMEIVERRTGMDFRDYLRTKILDPSGLSGFWVGVPEEIQSSLHFADVVSIPDEEFPGPGNDVDWSAPEIRALGLPAGGGLVTAADLALFYQPLLNAGKVFGGGQIVRPESIALGLTVLTDERHTFEVGETASTGPSGAPEGEPLRIAKLRGVIMELAGDDGDVTLVDGRTVPKNVFRQVGVGAKASGRSFGHGGAGGQIAWGDPESGISMAFVHNTFGPDAHPGKLVRDMERDL
jgi:CubicO group peptidase (beta-lactamase class C family)